MHEFCTETLLRRCATTQVSYVRDDVCNVPSVEMFGWENLPCRLLEFVWTFGCALRRSGGAVPFRLSGGFDAGSNLTGRAV